MNKPSQAFLAQLHELFGDDYPSEVKTLASNMHIAGQSIEAIRAAMLETYAKAPAPDDLAQRLPVWREEIMNRARHPE